jgi:hypothetical protein
MSQFNVFLVYYYSLMGDKFPLKSIHLREFCNMALTPETEAMSDIGFN